MVLYIFFIINYFIHKNLNEHYKDGIRIRTAHP